MSKQLEDGLTVDRAAQAGAEEHRQQVKLSTLEKKVLALAEQATGMGSSEVSGHTVDQVGRAIAVLVKWGLLFVAKMGHRSCRYFTNEEKARAYEATHKKVGEQRNKGSGLQKAPWTVDTPGVETAATKYTYGKSPSERVFRSNTHSGS